MRLVDSLATRVSEDFFAQRNLYFEILEINIIYFKRFIYSTKLGREFLCRIKMHAHNIFRTFSRNYQYRISREPYLSSCFINHHLLLCVPWQNTIAILNYGKFPTTNGSFLSLPLHPDVLLCFFNLSHFHPEIS